MLNRFGIKGGSYRRVVFGLICLLLIKACAKQGDLTKAEAAESSFDESGTFYLHKTTNFDGYLRINSGADIFADHGETVEITAHSEFIDNEGNAEVLEATRYYWYQITNNQYYMLSATSQRINFNPPNMAPNDQLAIEVFVEYRGVLYSDRVEVFPVPQPIKFERFTFPSSSGEAIYDDFVPVTHQPFVGKAEALAVLNGKYLKGDFEFLSVDQKLLGGFEMSVIGASDRVRLVQTVDVPAEPFFVRLNVEDVSGRTYTLDYPKRFSPRVISIQMDFPVTLVPGESVGGVVKVKNYGSQRNLALTFHHDQRILLDTQKIHLDLSSEGVGYADVEISMDASVKSYQSFTIDASVTAQDELLNSITHTLLSVPNKEERL